MKTERRHELRTNDLSAFLLDTQEWAKKHATALGTVSVVAVVVVLSVAMVSRSRDSSMDAAWETMRTLSFTLEDAEASFITLDGLISEAKDRDFKMKALLNKATRSMNMALLQAEGFQPEYLDWAEEAYHALLDGYADRMPVAATALGGLATIEENRFVTDGDLSHRDTARAFLERLQNQAEFKGTPFQTNAARRLQTLDETFQTITMVEPPPPPIPPVSISAEDGVGADAKEVGIKSMSVTPVNPSAIGRDSKPVESAPDERKSGEQEPDKPQTPASPGAADEKTEPGSQAAPQEKPDPKEGSETPSKAPETPPDDQ